MCVSYNTASTLCAYAGETRACFCEETSAWWSSGAASVQKKVGVISPFVGEWLSKPWIFKKFVMCILFIFIFELLLLLSYMVEKSEAIMTNELGSKYDKA